MEADTVQVNAARPTIFLDIDGVLNTSKNYSAYNSERMRRNVRFGTLDDPSVELLFDERLVANLNSLTEQSKAQIVVSSSWRLHYDGKGVTGQTFVDLAQLFGEVGITGDVVGPTPVQIYERGSAVEAWLRESGETRKIVILDDEHELMFGNQRHWVVRTDGEVGLDEKKVAQALAHLVEGRDWHSDFLDPLAP